MPSLWCCQNPPPRSVAAAGQPQEKPGPQRPFAKDPKIVPEARRELRDGEVRPSGAQGDRTHFNCSIVWTSPHDSSFFTAATGTGLGTSGEQDQKIMSA